MKQPQRNRTRRNLRANRMAEKYKYWTREERLCRTPHYRASHDYHEPTDPQHGGYSNGGQAW